MPLVNQIGKDTLPQLLALLARARVLVTPDSGPAHMATMVGTPVVGLYAATNPARSGPYLSAHWCVNAYPEAARDLPRRRARGAALDAQDRGARGHGADLCRPGYGENRRTGGHALGVAALDP